MNEDNIDIPIVDSTDDIILNNDENNNQLTQDNSIEYKKDRSQRRKRKSQQRIEAIIAENKMKDYQQQHLVELLQEKENQLAEARALAEQNAYYSNVYYEKSLEENENRILKELENAKEEGDIKKEIEIHKQLADIAAQKHTQRFSKTINRNSREEKYPDNNNIYSPEQFQNYQSQQQLQPQLSEHEEEWLEENPWADPNSPEYDQQLNNEFRELVENVNKRLRFNKRSDFIGSPEYLKLLSEEMNKRYGFMDDSRNNDEYENNNNSFYQERNNDIGPYRTPVAPVTRRESSMADQYLSRNNYEGTSITNEELDMARKMMPVYRSFKGRDITEKEAVAEFLKGKKLALDSQREKEKTRERLLRTGYYY